MPLASLIAFGIALFFLLMASSSFWMKSVYAPLEARWRDPEELVGLILSVLGQRNGWVVSEHRLMHAETEIDIWIANGRDHVRVNIGEGTGRILSNGNVKLRPFEQTLIWRAVEKFRNGIDDGKVIDFAKRAEAYGLKLKAQEEAARAAEWEAQKKLIDATQNPMNRMRKEEWANHLQWQKSEFPSPPPTRTIES